MLLEICCPDKIYRSIDLKSELNSFDADGETLFSLFIKCFLKTHGIPLVETLPFISPYLIDYSLKLFKHFKTKVNTKLNIRYSSF